MDATIQIIKQALGNFSVQNATEASRKALLEDALSLVVALEAPEDKLARLGWFEVRLIYELHQDFLKLTQIHRTTALKVGLNLGLFNKMAEDNETPKSVEKLAEKAGAEARLLSIVNIHAC